MDAYVAKKVTNIISPQNRDTLLDAMEHPENTHTNNSYLDTSELYWLTRAHN